MLSLKYRIIHKHGDEVTIIYSDDRYMLSMDGTLYENYGKSFKEPFWEQVYDSDCTVQMYTGIVDKNGKEIYDGDVVSFSPSAEDQRSCIWENKGYVWIPNIYEGVHVSYNHKYSEMSDSWLNCLNSIFERTDEWPDVEVIGNISYE